MIKELFDMQGQVAAVTGAASGLGLATAEVLARAGARVVLLDVDAAGLEAAKQAITSSGGLAETALLDVSDRAAVRAVIDDIARRHGRLDAVVANAGSRPKLIVVIPASTAAARKTRQSIWIAIGSIPSMIIIVSA